MTLKQKREIVKRFKAGESLWSLDAWWKSECIVGPRSHPEAIIRDFLNNKFSLKAKKREK